MAMTTALDLPISPLAQLILLGLAGILAWHAIPRRLAMARLVVQLAFFAAMTAVLLGYHMAPHRLEGYGAHGPGDLAVVAAKLLWWAHFAWATIGLVRLYLVVERHPQQARLLQDIVIAVVYLGVALAILSFVLGIPVAPLIATSGVVAIILGLALQSTLGDLFSGIALSFGRPYVLGDWILLADGTEGRVTATNWRSTHILTGANNVLALPNSMIAKIGITNLGRPDGSHAQSVTVRVAPTRMPSSIEEVMRSALASCGVLLRTPEPVVALRSVDAVAVELELHYRVRSPADRVPARNELLDLVYRHGKAAGLLFALPATAAVLMSELPSEEAAQAPQAGPRELIDAIPVFAALTPEERRHLAGQVRTRLVRAEEIVVEAGGRLDALMIVRSGIVLVRDGEREIRRLAPGDFFGETGLLADLGEPYALQALTRVVLYAIDREAVAPLLDRRPAMAEDLAAHLASSSRALANGEDHDPRRAGTRASSLLKAIRTAFRA